MFAPYNVLGLWVLWSCFLREASSLTALEWRTLIRAIACSNSSRWYSIVTFSILPSEKQIVKPRKQHSPSLSREREYISLTLVFDTASFFNMIILVSWIVPKSYLFVWMSYLLFSLCYSSVSGSAGVDKIAEIGAAIAIVDCIFGIYLANRCCTGFVYYEHRRRGCRSADYMMVKNNTEMGLGSFFFNTEKSRVELRKAENFY